MTQAKRVLSTPRRSAPTEQLIDQYWQAMEAYAAAIKKLGEVETKFFAKKQQTRRSGSPSVMRPGPPTKSVGRWKSLSKPAHLLLTVCSPFWHSSASFGARIPAPWKRHTFRTSANPSKMRCGCSGQGRAQSMPKAKGVDLRIEKHKAAARIYHNHDRDLEQSRRCPRE